MSRRSIRLKKYANTHGQDHGGDELWIVSYADMVTLLFGFFVILYSFSTLDDKKFDQMSERLAEAFQAKESAPTSPAETSPSNEQRQLRAFQMLVAMLNIGDGVDSAVAQIEASYADAKAAEAAKAVILEKVAAGHKDLVATAKSGALEELQTVDIILPDSALFPPGGAALAPAAAAKLKGLASDLRQIPNLAEIEIIGHTDSQAPPQPSPYSSNFALSSLRAGAVAEALIRYGVDRREVTVRGMADLKPLVPERDAAGHLLPENMAKNRRVNVVLKMRRVARDAPTN